MTYDPTNRMTASTYRVKDDTRTSDHTQILGNQEHFDQEFDVGHSSTTGAHGTINVPDLHEYADRDGLSVNPVPNNDIDVSLHLIHPTTTAVQVAFFQRLDVGADLDGIYEHSFAFGGDRIWCAYVALERVGTE